MTSSRRRVVRDIGWAIVYALLAGLVVCCAAKLAPADEADCVLLDFYADWCGPCRATAAQVDALAAEGFAVQRVNVEQERELAARFRVESLPCFVMLRGGQEVERVSGVINMERLRLMFRGASRPAADAKQGEPRPAWRYEGSAGHRAAIVRIYCQDGVRTRSIGSGTIVRWSGRIFVLTARHVIKDAKRILVELATKQTREARLLAADATWDCAVLEILGPLTGIDTAELEQGEAAMQTAGCRLESCGYGPDGRLACNTGLFQGYRRSSATPGGPDDWMVVSGHARSGDSGGGVFNTRGKLVGVLWGTDGENVVCVQAGRIHRLLNSVVAHRTTSETAAAGGTVRDGYHGIVSATPLQDGLPRSVSATSCASEQCLRRGTGEMPRQPSPPCMGQDDQLREAVRAIDNKLGYLVERQTAKPSEEREEGLSPVVASVVALAAVGVGVAIYFAARS